MAIILNDNIDTRAPKPTDNRFGPYETTAAALEGIPEYQRYIGLTVGVGTPIKEYWFTTITTLEEKKSSGTVGGITQGSGISITGTETLTIAVTTPTQLTTNISTDVIADGASDVKYPSVKATKAYVDSNVAGLLDDRGNFPATSGNYPTTKGSGPAGAIRKGDLWFISVPGNLNGIAVEIGASVRALIDDAGSNTDDDWDILDTGLGFIPENVNNKVIRGTSIAAAPTSETKYASLSALTEYLASIPASTPTLEQVLIATPSQTSIGYAINLQDTAVPTLKTTVGLATLKVENTSTGKSITTIPDSITIASTGKKTEFTSDSITFTNAAKTLAINAVANNNTVTLPNQTQTLVASVNNSIYADASTGDITIPYVGGTGTINYVPKWSSSTELTDSQIFDNGTNVGVGISTGLTKKFTVDGNIWMKHSSDTKSSGLSMGSQNNYITFRPTVTGSIGGNDLAIDTFYEEPPFVVDSGFNNNVKIIKIQSDGKVLVGGSFTTYRGVGASRIIRLNTDGSIDTSFAYLGGFNSNVSSIAIQNNGKIIVVGNFTTYQGVSAGGIIRLNPDGTIDTSFNSGLGFGGPVSGVAIQNDGTIICVGAFPSYDTTLASTIISLNSNGSINTSFDYGSGLNGANNSVAIQSDGKVIVAGSFTTYRGSNSRNIVRINTDGTIDSSFLIGTGLNGQTISIAIQSDGKILLGGVFTQYKGLVTSNCIIRLNADGTKDTSFLSGTGFDSFVRDIAIQSDGKILCVGDYSGYNTTLANGIIRLEANGTVDPSFVVGSGFNSTPYTIAISNKINIFIGGFFTTFNTTTSANKIIRLFASIPQPENTRVTIRRDTGNVGIGTTTPGYKLDVVNTATPQANYARFANDNNDKNAIILSTSASSAISLFGASSERKLLIGNGIAGVAPFVSYNDNIINFTYSDALGGAKNPASLVTFTPQFVYSTGTNNHTILDIHPEITITGGTNTLRGVYYNPNNTIGTPTTHIAFENVNGDVLLGTTSGQVGIATSTPNAATKLDVRGNCHIGTEAPSTFIGVGHTMEVSATGVSVPLTIIGGSPILEAWSNSTRSNGAVAFGAAFPGSTSDGNVHISTYRNVTSSWFDRIIVEKDEGRVRIGAGSSVAVLSALLEVNSTTKGFLPPKMTTAQMFAIVSPAEGLIVYNTDAHALVIYGGSPLGWQKISMVPF
jgi:uncharacterized delta-60 repeat protein